MRTSAMNYSVRNEVQEIDGGYAGYVVTEDVKNGKVVQVVSCVKVTKTYGNPRKAADELRDSQLAKFATRQ